MKKRAEMKYWEFTQVPTNFEHVEYVRNWEHRIKNYTAEQKRIYATMWESEKEYDQLLIDTSLKWKLQYDD